MSFFCFSGLNSFQLLPSPSSDGLYASDLCLTCPQGRSAPGIRASSSSCWLCFATSGALRRRPTPWSLYLTPAIFHDLALDCFVPLSGTPSGRASRHRRCNLVTNLRRESFSLSIFLAASRVCVGTPSCHPLAFVSDLILFLIF
jgi:hypothetical protein